MYMYTTCPMCGGQRTTFRRGSFHLTMGSRLRYSAWWLVPLITELSCWLHTRLSVALATKPRALCMLDKSSVYRATSPVWHLIIPLKDSCRRKQAQGLTRPFSSLPQGTHLHLPCLPDLHTSALSPCHLVRQGSQGRQETLGEGPRKDFLVALSQSQLPGGQGMDGRCRCRESPSWQKSLASSEYPELLDHFKNRYPG